MELQIATRSSWKTLPPAEEFKAVSYKDVFDAPEMAGIERGLIPQDMEDKWFAFFERPFLYLHRSWTGHLVYRVKVLTSEGAGQVDGAEVLRTPDGGARYPGEYEAELLRFLVRCVTWGKSFPFRHLRCRRTCHAASFKAAVAGTGQDEAKWVPVPWWKRWLRRSTRR